MARAGGVPAPGDEAPAPAACRVLPGLAARASGPVTLPEQDLDSEAPVPRGSVRARPQDPAPGEWGTPSHTSWEVLAPTGAPDVSGRTCRARRRLQPPAFCFRQGRVCTDARAPSLLCMLGTSLRRGRCSEHRWWPGNAGPCVTSARVRNQKPVSEGRRAGGATRLGGHGGGRNGCRVSHGASAAPEGDAEGWRHAPGTDRGTTGRAHASRRRTRGDRAQPLT